MTPPLGVSGRLARAFLHSKLTPLLAGAALLLGFYAVVALPREEEPQIVVPMIDVFVDLPGASATEVEQRVTRPIERLLWEIPGVEYLYSTSSQGRAMIVTRFVVGEDEDRALVRLHQKLAGAAGTLPPAATTPLIQARSIDDVPVMALTIWGGAYDAGRLRLMASLLRDAVKDIPDVSEVTLIGGHRREVAVTIDPAALDARGLDLAAVAGALTRGNVRQPAGSLIDRNQAAGLEAGAWLDSSAAVREVVVGLSGGAPVHLADVARIDDGGGDPESYVTFHDTPEHSNPAVTIAIAKRRGANAIDITRAIARRIETVRGTLVPRDLNVTVTRDYGETAAHKSNELLWHMLVAVLSVSVLIWAALGRRASVVVLIAIPVTLALTLFVFYLYGYTLNRITLFALIFSIGILVDDAIVVVENVARHARLSSDGAVTGESAVRAVDEVGNPTILATLTVVAAIVPMAFVGGLMGPYMRPIPIGASAAMLFSLAVAFIVTPWAAVRLLGRSHDHAPRGGDRMTALYRRVMARLITEPRWRWSFFGAVGVLLAGAVALVPLGLVTVKMLPFDNKSELQVIVRAPDDTPLESTARIASELAAAAMRDPDVLSVQSYAGAASPYTFNGLVRHYFLRQAAHDADLQIQLRPPPDRHDQSHVVAGRLREALFPVGEHLGATIQVVEVPPGPPVLQTLVAEIYGPNPETRRHLAHAIKGVFAQTPGVVDVDWYVESPRHIRRLEVDVERAAMAGVTADEVATAVHMAGAGVPVGLLHDPAAREDVPIVFRLPRAQRGSTDAVASIRLAGGTGLSVGELTRPVLVTSEPSVYHKNLQPVTYVTGDLAGRAESPVYAIHQMNPAIGRLTGPGGEPIAILNTRQPDDPSAYAMKWDGEWHITYEVFRDLGIAFAAVLVLIYLLVVGWFQSFRTPIAIMLAIPFSLVGILPAHALSGAFFTATSMIGFIAGAGIVVRNSIILVDFIELRIRDGMPLEDAVIDAGAVRFRPMALTAAAVIAGSAVILFDPIFQGLAMALMAGEVASLLLSRMTVPVVYYVMQRRARTAATTATQIAWRES
jgi:multidrug efflux pump subunit AcrB